MSSDLKQLNKLKKNSRRNNQLQEPKFVERLIKISRVSKVTKGGKKMRAKLPNDQTKNKTNYFCR